MALYLDVSDRSLLHLEGPDGLDLFQRISTNDVSALKEGEHALTVLTSEKGRIVDVVLVVRIDSESLLIFGLTRDAARLRAWIEGFIVMENVRVLSPQRGIVVMLFDVQENQVRSLAVKHKLLGIKLNPMDSRFVILCPDSASNSSLENDLCAQGIRQASTAEYEEYRISNGIPDSPNEFNEHFNPLEVGLGHFVSFTKGCYVGQEVIARLDTYQKIQRKLVRLLLTQIPAGLPTPLTLEDRSTVGMLTSCSSVVQKDNRVWGLGLVSSNIQALDLIVTDKDGNDVARASVLQSS
jgi:folate-binding protein YgfZ